MGRCRAAKRVKPTKLVRTGDGRTKLKNATTHVTLDEPQTFADAAADGEDAPVGHPDLPGFIATVEHLLDGYVPVLSVSLQRALDAIFAGTASRMPLSEVKGLVAGKNVTHLLAMDIGSAIYLVNERAAAVAHLMDDDTSPDEALGAYVRGQLPNVGVLSRVVGEFHGICPELARTAVRRVALMCLHPGLYALLLCGVSSVRSPPPALPRGSFRR